MSASESARRRSRFGKFAGRLGGLLFTDDPRSLLPFLIPTGLGLTLDLALRARWLAGYALQGKGIYVSSLAISAAVWTLPLWSAAKLFAASTHGTLRSRLLARVGLALFFALWVLPIATFGYGGQLLYFRVMHQYMGRDTIRLGFALRGTVTDWFRAWGSSGVLFGMIASGLVLTAVLMAVTRRASATLPKAIPWAAAITFPAALILMSVDLVDSQFLQAATPDDCFMHGVVHAIVLGVTGHGGTRRGFTLREPAPLPPLPKPAHSPNVVVVLTESVRADATCSDPPPSCTSRFFDAVVPDRVPLGKLTTVSSGTFTACMVLFTGLPVNADIDAIHKAPVLWELARSVGYRTAYVTSQNFLFENYGVFVKNAGIDLVLSATDLGGLGQEQLGAPDERATEAALHFIRETPSGTPYFAVVHLSNTHAPYRVDPDLEPDTPHSKDPLGDTTALRNHYQNSVLLQERTVASFFGELQKLPSWSDTVVIFLSDHGEQFRERGGLYHLHTVFDEEVRIPGFIAGAGLKDDQREALRSFSGHRTFTHDVHDTIVDLFGLGDARAKLPFANPIARSLVAPPGWTSDPLVPMSTSSAVWDADDVRWGLMRGEKLMVGAPGADWACYDIAHDPREDSPFPPSRCGHFALDEARATRF